MSYRKPLLIAFALVAGAAVADAPAEAQKRRLPIYPCDCNGYYDRQSAIGPSSAAAIKRFNDRWWHGWTCASDKQVRCISRGPRLTCIASARPCGRPIQ